MNCLDRSDETSSRVGEKKRLAEKARGFQDSGTNIYGQLKHVILPDLIYLRQEKYEMVIYFER